MYFQYDEYARIMFIRNRISISILIYFISENSENGIVFNFQIIHMHIKQISFLQIRSMKKINA